jgi:hypothetical protein
MSIMQIIYLIYFKPLVDKKELYMEIFNEMIVVISSYNTFIYFYLNDEPELKYSLGWVAIGLVFF